MISGLRCDVVLNPCFAFVVVDFSLGLSLDGDYRCGVISLLCCAVVLLISQQFSFIPLWFSDRKECQIGSEKYPENKDFQEKE